MSACGMCGGVKPVADCYACGGPSDAWLRNEVVSQLVDTDQMGSFRTADGRIEVVNWTHRGGPWMVLDGRRNLVQHDCKTRDEAVDLVVNLVHGWDESA